MGCAQSNPKDNKKDNKKKNKNFDNEIDANRDQAEGDDIEKQRRDWDSAYQLWQQLKGPKPGPHPDPDHGWNIDPDNYEAEQ